MLPPIVIKNVPGPASDAVLDDDLISCGISLICHRSGLRKARSGRESVLLELHVRNQPVGIDAGPYGHGARHALVEDERAIGRLPEYGDLLALAEDLVRVEFTRLLEVARVVECVDNGIRPSPGWLPAHGMMRVRSGLS